MNNGGAEAYVELSKALNIVGDYRLKTSVNTNRWAIPPTAGSAITVGGTGATTLTSSWPDTDYMSTITSFAARGNPVYTQVEIGGSATAGNAYCGNMGSCAFAMSTDLETSNGVEISGLNAEEQSDISLLANWYAPQSTTNIFEIYSYYDAMVILRENNVLGEYTIYVTLNLTHQTELIQ